LLLLFATGAQADPLVITGGTAIIDDPIFKGESNFNLIAPGFVASGAGRPLHPAGPTAIYGSRFFPGTVTSNGIVLAGTFDDRTHMLFVLPPFTQIPRNGVDPYPGLNTVVVNTTFTMTGFLVLSPPSSGMCCEPPIFSSLVTGSGFVQITYRRVGSEPIFVPSQVVYAFGATEPIPEPATLVLLGTGLAGVMVKARRRRRKL
jgi:hypothetical protein